MEFDPALRRRKPPEEFFVFSMSARDLRALSGIERRNAEGGARRIEDTGIQRAHDPSRSSEINRFVENGFPWSTLAERERKSGEFDDLRKPGWLPTAIVVNVLTSQDTRPRGVVQDADLVQISITDHGALVTLPRTFATGWKPNGIHPIEVIDGQHRLWAFDESFTEPYDLPVVAFQGLDVSWQAYLFWTINIKPTKINPSLAFDLYPLLRSEDWLERSQGPKIYREARAQELTEVMWSSPLSPWHRRINMLGQTRGLGVTQAGWVRTLVATLLRRPTGPASRSKGLFTAPLGRPPTPLAWNRTQQASIMLFGWKALEEAVAASREDWAAFLRKDDSDPVVREGKLDAAFAGKNTYLNTEQGIRAWLAIFNDLLAEAADRLALADWESRVPGGDLDDSSLEIELKSLAKQDSIVSYIRSLAAAIATFDWRGVDAPGLLSDEERAMKRAFRGSGGYVEFRRQLLRWLGGNAQGELKRDANELLRHMKV